MINQKSILLYIVIIFAVVYSAVFFINEKNFTQRVDLILENKISTLETHYKIFMYNQKVLSDTIFNDTMNKKDVIEILTKASQTQDKQELQKLRNQLQKKLEFKYAQIKKMGILQYHFVLPNNHVFLRMHKTSKFGDDLTNIRQDFSYVNKNKLIVRGFSNGRTAHGFRNVYPLYSKDKKHIGAMEISYSSELLQDYLSKLGGLHSHFLIDKGIFDSKAWERDDMVLKYFPSAENKNLMFHMTGEHTHDRCILSNKQRLGEFARVIEEKLQLEKKFVVYLPNNIKSNVISFYPVQQNVTKEIVAWIASYEYVSIIEDITQDKNYINIALFFILLIIFYFIYKNLLQQSIIKINEKNLSKKTKEQEVLLSLFDKGDSVLLKWKNDKQWSIKHVSLSIETLLGYSKDDFISGKINYVSCIHEEDVHRVEEELKEGENTGSDFFAQYPYRVITKNDEVKWVLQYTTVQKDSKKKVKYFIGNIVDITEQKNKDQLLHQQTKLASMGEMIGNIAHQWRQPLSIISTSATGMQAQHQLGLLDDATIPTTCKLINDNAQYLSQTIDDFRNFIKDEKNLTSFNLTEVINSFLHLVNPSVKTDGINIVLDLDDTLELVSYENELKQCFINIFNNAKDALKSNNNEEKFFFVITSKVNKDGLSIVFLDNAGGVKEDVIYKVFEPYFTTKHKSQGTGLGLHMTYNIIVNRMQGSIYIENSVFEHSKKQYKGAKITIKLPLSIS